MSRVPKFIIDLDTGVDDAMALLVALHAHKKGQIRIMAITTVAGNCKNEFVVRNTFRTLDVAKCGDIPVHRGSDHPMVVKYDSSHYGFHGKDGFNDLKFDNEPDLSRLKEESANEAILRIVKQNPNEITFVALAPLTNLALALKTDRNLVTNLHEIFIMGGNTEGIGNVSVTAEFNFFADPEAAFVVLDVTECPTYIVPWEMCYKYVKPSMSWRKTVLGGMTTPEANLMNTLEQVWFDDYHFDPEHWIMCDQFVMIAAVDRSSITAIRNAKATVELAGHVSRGNMILEQRIFVVQKKDFKTNVILIDRMDEEKIKEHLLDAFGR